MGVEYVPSPIERVCPCDRHMWFLWRRREVALIGDDGEPVRYPNGELKTRPKYTRPKVFRVCHVCASVRHALLRGLFR